MIHTFVTPASFVGFPYGRHMTTSLEGVWLEKGTSGVLPLSGHIGCSQHGQKRFLLRLSRIEEDCSRCREADVGYQGGFGFGHEGSLTRNLGPN